jgi:long-chain acyl-CoA synthetase
MAVVVDNDYPYAYPDKKCEKIKGETLPYKSALLGEDEPLASMPAPGIDTMKKVFIKSVEEFSGLPCLGTRPEIDRDDKGEAVFGKYEYITYQEAYDSSLNLAKSLCNLKLYSEPKVNGQTYKLIGILAKNCEQWVISDLACSMSGIATVTLYDTLGKDSTQYIIKQSELNTIICTSDHITHLIETKNENKIDHFTNIISMNEVSHEDQKACDKNGIKLYKYNELIEAGEGITFQLSDPEPQDLLTICYTSGTTGSPKGVMLSHANLVSLLAASINSGIELTKKDVHLSYLPLAHIFERINCVNALLNGASIGFYQGDVLKIADDLAALRPTIFASVPRLYTRLYDKIKIILSELKGCKKSLAQRAIKTKMANLHKNGAVKHCLYDCLVFKKMRARLGGRVRFCITGSAPISKEVLDFLKICFSCDILEGYGQTELTGGCTVTGTGDKFTGHVGGVIKSFYLKLQDVPEMNYLSTDMRNGKNFPRGEI